MSEFNLDYNSSTPLDILVLIHNTSKSHSDKRNIFGETSCFPEIGKVTIGDRECLMSRRVKPSTLHYR